MAQDYAKAFYNSAAWRKCRASFISGRQSIDGGLCQWCGTDLGFIVHHKQWINPDNINTPDITLNHDNLEYLCKACHNRAEKDYFGIRYRFDEAGQLIPIPPLNKNL